MPKVGVCPAGHPQEPTTQGSTMGYDPESKKMIPVHVVLSAPRADRPGRCHRCGGVLQYINEADL